PSPAVILPSAATPAARATDRRSFDGEDRKKHTSELQSRSDLVCRLLLEKKNENEKPRRSSLIQANRPRHQFQSGTGSQRGSPFSPGCAPPCEGSFPRMIPPRSSSLFPYTTLFL